MASLEFDNNAYFLQEANRGVDSAVLEDMGHKMIDIAERAADPKRAELAALTSLEAAAGINARTIKQKNDVTRRRILAKFHLAHSLGMEPELATDESGEDHIYLKDQTREDELYVAWSEFNHLYSNADPTTASSRQARMRQLEAEIPQ